MTRKDEREKAPRGFWWALAFMMAAPAIIVEYAILFWLFR